MRTAVERQRVVRRARELASSGAAQELGVYRRGDAFSRSNSSAEQSS